VGDSLLTNVVISLLRHGFPAGPLAIRDANLSAETCPLQSRIAISLSNKSSWVFYAGASWKASPHAPCGEPLVADIFSLPSFHWHTVRRGKNIVRLLIDRAGAADVLAISLTISPLHLAKSRTPRSRSRALMDKPPSIRSTRQ